MNFFLLSVLFFTSAAYSSTHIAHFSKGNIHYLSKIDIDTGTQMQVTQLGKATNSTSLIYTTKENKLLAVLQQQGNRDDVVILNKNTLKEMARISVPKVKWPDVEGLTISPILISADDTKLVVISQLDSRQEINIFDIKTQDKLFTRKFSGHKYIVSGSLDLNYITFENISPNNHMFIVINISSYKTSAIANLGLSPVNIHIFKNSLLISSERSSKRNKYYGLSRIDFKTNKKTNYENRSLNPFAFVHNNEQNQLFVVGQNIKKKQDLFVLKLLKNNTFKKTNFKKKVQPLKVVLNKNNTKLMVIGEYKLATIDIKTNTLQSRIRIPFDPLTGFMNGAGSIGYVQEDEGSEVGSFDLVKGKLIEQSNAGRFLNQVLVNTRKILFTGLLSNFLFDRNNSQNYIMLDNNEKQLFVINSTTNDLTIFDAYTLKKQYSKGTGFKTYFMSQATNINSPVLVIGKNKISLINNQSNNLILQLQDAEFKGLDKDNGLLFYLLQNTLHVYDMLNSKELSVINDFNVLAIHTY